MKLEETLRDGRSEQTAKQYLARLRLLNGGQEIKSLAYLKNRKAMEEKIGEKAESTRPSYYSAILAAITPLKSYAGHATYYRKRLLAVNESIKKALATHEKTEAQEKSMIPVEDINKRREELKRALVNEPKTEKEWMGHLLYLVLSLYTLIPPRRNQDYLYMYAVKKEPKELSKERNYYVADKRQFIFNRYKTADTFGMMRLDIPESLAQVLTEYLKHYAQYQSGEPVPLIAFFDGRRPSEKNGMTRLLNKAIGKKVGSTALRHIYLSDRYGNELEREQEMARDRMAMAHGASTQLEYIKR